MKYMIIEFQTNANDSCATIVSTYDSLNEAESKYHQILSAAAISNVPKHGAFCLTDDSMYVKSEYFTHDDSIEL